jgi:hypothetical protein
MNSFAIGPRPVESETLLLMSRSEQARSARCAALVFDASKSDIAVGRPGAIRPCSQPTVRRPVASLAGVARKSTTRFRILPILAVFRRMDQDTVTTRPTVRASACVAIPRRGAVSSDVQIHQGDFIGFNRLGAGSGGLFLRVRRRRR